MVKLAGDWWVREVGKRTTEREGEREERERDRERN